MPPRSRRLCSQPDRRTLASTSAARSSPQVWDRYRCIVHPTLGSGGRPPARGKYTEHSRLPKGYRDGPARLLTYTCLAARPTGASPRDCLGRVLGVHIPINLIKVGSMYSDGAPQPVRAEDVLTAVGTGLWRWNSVSGVVDMDP